MGNKKRKSKKSDLLRKEINTLIIKLHYLISISESDRSKDAYSYMINELHFILND
jgi:hypothetical protein